MKPITIFALSSFALALLFFLFPINIFDGEVVLVNGIQRMTEKAPLSLSYFIGIGYQAEEMQGIESFRLLPTGYTMAFLLIFCLPALIAYRVHLSRIKKNKA